MYRVFLKIYIICRNISSFVPLFAFVNNHLYYSKCYYNVSPRTSRHHGLLKKLNHSIIILYSALLKKNYTWNNKFFWMDKRYRHQVKLFETICRKLKWYMLSLRVTPEPITIWTSKWLNNF